MSSVSITRGGRPVDVKSMASADQETIVGNGSTELPFRAASGSGLTATFDAVSGFGVPHPGLFVSALPDNEIILGDASSAGILPEGASPSEIIGVITRVTDGLARVQVGGIVELDLASWDLATGGTGGLDRGQVYYLAAQPGGKITTSPPSGSNESVVQLGVALNPTTMITSTPSIAFLNP